MIVAHVDSASGDGIKYINSDGITLNMYTVTGCGGNGVSLDTVASSVGLNNGQTSGNGGDGIYLVDTNNVQITECISTGNTGYGVNVSNAGCSRTQIVGNIIYGNTAGQINDSGTATMDEVNIKI